MESANFYEKRTLTNGQVVGLFGAVAFCAIFYQVTQDTTKNVEVMSQETIEYRNSVDKQFEEVKGLVYRVSRERTDEVENEIKTVKEGQAKIKEWVDYRKGYLQATKDLSK